jgi:glycosyltransferase involved in cell wall biosynthesis
MNRATYFLNTYVVAVSDAVLASIRRHSSYPLAKLTRIYNGIRPRNDVDQGIRGRLRQELHLSDDTFIVGNVANLHPRKGHKFLLQALRVLVNEGLKVHCVVIGRDDGEGSALRRLAKELGLEGFVHCLGYRQDARTLLAAFDAFVLPSLFEGLPVALIEAMDAGLPIVATRVGGNPELVVDGETGFLVEAGSAEKLAMAISALLADPIKRYQMGEAAKIRMRRDFTADQMATRYVELYKSLVHQRSSPIGN